MPPELLLALIGGGLSLLQGGLGAGELAGARKQERRNTFPPYTIQPEFQKMIDLLTGTLGLPSPALNYYYNRAGQAMSGGLNAALAAGASPNTIARIIQGNQSAFEDVLMRDAMQRKQDIGGLAQAQLALAGEKDKAYQINQLDRYKDKAAAIALEKQAGYANIGGAFNTAASFGADYATTKLGAPNLPKAKDASTPSAVPYADIARYLDTSKISGMQPSPYDIPNLTLPNTPSGLNLPQSNFSLPFGVFQPSSNTLNFGAQPSLSLDMYNPSLFNQLFPKVSNTLSGFNLPLPYSY